MRTRRARWIAAIIFGIAVFFGAPGAKTSVAAGRAGDSPTVPVIAGSDKITLEDSDDGSSGEVSLTSIQPADVIVSIKASDETCEPELDGNSSVALDPGVPQSVKISFPANCEIPKSGRTVTFLVNGADPFTVTAVPENAPAPKWGLLGAFPLASLVGAGLVVGAVWRWKPKRPSALDRDPEYASLKRAIAAEEDAACLRDRAEEMRAEANRLQADGGDLAVIAEQHATRAEAIASLAEARAEDLQQKAIEDAAAEPPNPVEFEYDFPDEDNTGELIGFRDRFKMKLPSLGADWKFSDSWASNVTILSGAFAAIIGSGSVVEALVGAEDKDVIAVALVASVVSAAFVGAAPLLLKIVGPADQVTCCGLTLASVATVTGALGQLTVLALLALKLDLKGFEWFIGGTGAVAVILLCVYVFRSTLWNLQAGGRTAGAPDPTMMDAATLIANAINGTSTLDIRYYPVAEWRSRDGERATSAATWPPSRPTPTRSAVL
jgi:hypothetical protein